MADAATPTRTREEKWYGGGKDKGASKEAAGGAGSADAGKSDGAGAGEGEGAEKKELTAAERHKQERADMLKRHDKAFSDLRKLNQTEIEAMFDRHGKELETGTTPEGDTAAAPGADASGNEAAAPAA